MTAPSEGPTLLFKFEHPIHGLYHVFYDERLKTYGITRSPVAPWCAYGSLTEVFKQKGL